MALRHRQMRQISRALYTIISGAPYQQCNQAAKLSSLCHIPLNPAREKIDPNITERRFYAQRFSTVAEISQQDPHEFDLVSFIESTFGQLKGCYHCWINRTQESKDYFKKDGVFVVLANAVVENPPAMGFQLLFMLERAKILKQRYPWLHVFAFLSGSSVLSITSQAHLLDVIMKEYITFPFLLSNKTFPEMANGACYVLFQGFRTPSIYLERDTDLGVLQKAIKDFNEQHNEEHDIVHKLKSTWSKQNEFVIEPNVSSSMRSLFLHFPACISLDESGNRFFLSDSNHHRIIIFDGDGKILDSIGSSPGFEDGEFEIAKLMRPAGSYYDASEDFLYILDSENHAVRRADMERRVLETLYPTGKHEDKSGLWIWIMNKLGWKRDAGVKSNEFDSETLMFPWHLMKRDDNWFAINRSFDTLWILDLDQRVISDVLKGSEKILEVCEQTITERISQLKRFPHDWIQQLIDSTHSLDGIPYSGLLSSFVATGDQLTICDAAGQGVLTLDRETEVVSGLQFSNFGVLGLPYWLHGSFDGKVHGEVPTYHLQSFTLLPGRINMQLNIDIPRNTVLVEPLQEGSVWCQARGAAVEVPAAENTEESSEKVGVAQQWYDELDNAAFSEPEVVFVEEKSNSDADVDDDRVQIDCTVSTSPGTGEVIICAALYLKLKNSSTTGGDDHENKAAVMADVLVPVRTGMVEGDAFIHLLSMSNYNLDDLVFMKPLHVKIRLNTLDHPKADSSKDIILTDSTVEVNVSLTDR
ncbi:hypothetical protein Ancab_039696 [Ancistrocladus abbreviatus]